MRKSAALAAASALTVAVGAAGVAEAVNSQQTMDVKMAKTVAGTSSKPKSVGTLTVDLKVNVDQTDAPFATRSTVLYFDKNLVFNGSKFPTCTVAQARSGSPACTKAKVGSGSAQGLALGQLENLVVTAYNADKGKQLLLRVKGATPLQIDTVIIGKLQTASGKYGRKLNVTIPDNLQQPLTGVFATLTRFVTKVGGTVNNTPYIGLKGCSGGKLQFKGDFTFTDGSKQAPTDTVNCKKS